MKHFFFFYIFSISKSKIIFELSFSCGSYRTRLARFCSNNMASQLPHDIYTTQRCLEIRMSSSSSTSDKDTGFSADYKVYSGSASIATSCRRFVSTFFFLILVEIKQKSFCLYLLSAALKSFYKNTLGNYLQCTLRLNFFLICPVRAVFQ